MTVLGWPCSWPCSPLKPLSDREGSEAGLQTAFLTVLFSPLCLCLHLSPSGLNQMVPWFLRVDLCLAKVLACVLLGKGFAVIRETEVRRSLSC